MATATATAKPTLPKPKFESLPLFIDDRGGSSPVIIKEGPRKGTKYPGVIEYPPLSTCQTCGLEFKWADRNDWTCSSGDLSHNSLATICRLDSADMMMVGNGPPDNPSISIGAELKSLSDLLSSWDSGRLQATQIPAMLDTYTIKYVIYYGTFKPGPNGELLVPSGYRDHPWKIATLGKRKIPYAYLQSIISYINDLGIRTDHVKSLSELAVWLGCLNRRWSKPWEARKGMHVFDSSYGRIQGSNSLLPTHTAHTAQLAEVVRGLPSLGFARAVAAGEYFDSIQDAFNADADEWMAVSGIGKTIAESVVRAIRARRSGG